MALLCIGRTLPIKREQSHSVTEIISAISFILMMLLNRTMAKRQIHTVSQSAPKQKPLRPRDPVASGERDAAVNRIASHNYFLMEKFECGVALRGTEVKSVRAGQVQLRDSYALVKDDELWLLNAHIGPYSHGNIQNHEPVRTRKLLVHSTELDKLENATRMKGMTLVPTRMYFRRGRVKCEVAVAKGKQMWDKRETERRRTAASEAKAAIARNIRK